DSSFSRFMDLTAARKTTNLEYLRLCGHPSGHGNNRLRHQAPAFTLRLDTIFYFNGSFFIKPHNT
ncbi:MAG TPA: hypothetical protein PLQ28_09945, partial [Flexilinea sp.]|nr:hypothetical protein [Flexilinea sp.]